MRTFTIVGGTEPTNMVIRYMAAGYASPEQMIQDLEVSKQLVVQMTQKTIEKPSEKPFDIDAFLDKINKEKIQGDNIS